MDMSWNHRVMKQKDGDDDWYQIHEVHYKDDKVHGYTKNGTTVAGHSIEELRWNLEKMLEALDKEILDYED
jgi:hypothetical protein